MRVFRVNLTIFSQVLLFWNVHDSAKLIGQKHGMLKILQWNAMLWDISYSKNSKVISGTLVFIGPSSRPP